MHQKPTFRHYRFALDVGERPARLNHCETNRLVTPRAGQTIARNSRELSDATVKSASDAAFLIE